MNIQIKCLNKFGPLIEKSKRVKLIVGGRGSTKTTFVCDYVLGRLQLGKIWCCGREFQNSIGESVYRSMCDEIERLQLTGFIIKATTIEHESGGYAFFVGLARNITSIKGMLSGVEGLWVEEAEATSENTLRVLTASLRNSAKDVQEMLEAGIDIENMPVPEIWVTMNRGSRADPISKKWLARADAALFSCAYYEDDLMIAVQANYTDMPRAWFIGSGLETERLDDERTLTPAQYRHKWGADYLETIENAIIQPEWFDSCVDAHIKLGFDALGQERCSYDPADIGDDPAAWGYQHGSVVKEVLEYRAGDVVKKTDWAIKETNRIKPDAFTWDCDGLGAGCTFQIDEGFKGKKIVLEQFKGSFGADKPEAIYMPVNEIKKQKKNKETFLNWRSQFYTALADKMLRTHIAVTRGTKVYNPDELISFDSSIEDINGLKVEICRIPIKPGGRIQILSKEEMKKLKIDSPNRADVVMMLQRDIEITRKPKPKPIPIEGW